MRPQNCKDGRKSRGKEQMDRNVPIVSELPNLVIAWSQLGINGQDSGDSASGMAIVKANEFNYDSYLIISDAKRRRSSNGLLPIVGLEEVDIIIMMENSDVPKNGPAVGPVTETNELLKMELSWIRPPTNSSGSCRPGQAK